MHYKLAGRLYGYLGKLADSIEKIKTIDPGVNIHSLKT